LFSVPFERVEIVLHRESIVHSLVEFVDGSVKAQLGEPDMRLPIRIALCYPQRVTNPETVPLDLARAGELHFAPVDYRRYPALALALKAGREGGTYPAALAAADEVAVGHFLDGRLAFMDIVSLLEDAVSAHKGGDEMDIDAILAADAWARGYAEEWVRKRA
jgi:1-deoxy-D-xylulose-5-phosphate reductoisomerase